MAKLIGFWYFLHLVRDALAPPVSNKMRKPVIAGNWKMFKLVSESVETAVQLKSRVTNANHCEVVIAPVFAALKSVADRLEGSNVKVAAQNCAAASDYGAYTGEVAAVMVKDAGCTHVILGHSERRQFFGDTDGSVNQKTKSALAAGLTAIVCVGESLAEREAGREVATVVGQLNASLEGLTVADMERIIIAYEPVWAIGTGKTATPEQAQDMHAAIRKAIKDSHGSDIAGKIRILYGGSVKPDNIAALMSQEDVDGALVGGASLEPETFASIVDYRR